MTPDRPSRCKAHGPSCPGHAKEAEVERAVLELHELQRVLAVARERTDAFGPEAYAVLLLTYDLALRAGEVCGVRGSQIDFASGRSRVPRLKGGKVFPLDLAGATLAAIRPFARSDAVFFPAWTLDKVRVTYRRVVQLAGLNARPGSEGGVAYSHCLRRSRATHLYEDGADIVEIQHRLGHKSKATTLLYLGATAEARRKAAQRAVDGVNRVLGQS